MEASHLSILFETTDFLLSFLNFWRIEFYYPSSPIISSNFFKLNVIVFAKFPCIEIEVKEFHIIFPLLYIQNSNISHLLEYTLCYPVWQQLLATGSHCLPHERETMQTNHAIAFYPNDR
jgi:hypothetical protein